MNPTPILRTALFALALALPGAAPAQDQAQDQPQEQPGETEALPAAPGAEDGAEPVVAATHRDWRILCTTAGEGGPEMCEMYQLLETEDGPIAEISIVALPAESELAAGATITTPLETFLPNGLLFRVDAGQQRQEPYQLCAVIGCIARIGLRAEEVEAMRRGVSAFLTIAHYTAADQPIEIPVSLLGFTAAMEDLQARMPAE